ncbi:MAG: ATP-binding cassette domain-containing protein [candidate division Zixibacteria bacterium]|nr:ATP-binding cassette domain-containing protein [candidate division Zixibacteria bacterium]
MSSRPLVNIKNLSVSFLEKVIIDKLSFSIGRGEVVALIGANGCGKTTLLELVSHTYAQNRDYLNQFELRVKGDLNLATGIGLSYLPQMVKSDIPEIDYSLAAMFERLAESFGLHQRSSDGDTLSDGQIQKEAIVVALVSDADLLLLDEPTNYLDIAGITAFEEQIKLLRRRGRGILLVSHDRTLINNLANRTIYMARNGIFQTEGGFSDAWSLAGMDFNSKLKQARVIRTKIGRLQNEVRRKMNWAEQKEKTKTGSKKDKGHISRLAAKLAARARAASLKARKEIDQLKKTKPIIPKKLVLRLPEYEVRNREVFSLADVSFSYGEAQSENGGNLLEAIDLAATTSDKLCLMGTNGAGKSTLLSLIMGRLKPLCGTRRINDAIKLRHLPQGLTGFFDQPTLLDNFRDTGSDETTVRYHLGAALLRGEKVNEPVTNFSYGELVRAAIVKCILQKAEFLLLDEPTSHLDIESIEVLEQLLIDFPGGFVIISHDRSFVENVSDKLYTLDGGRLRLV